MRRELLELAAELARRGEAFALATVVARTPPISAQVGDSALVTRDGGFHGWVGGSCTRPTVIAEALAALGDHKPRLVALDPHPESRARPGLTVFPMTCHSGGAVEIHIQPVLPPPRLVVYGLSPTARALVRLGKAMGYRVELVDPAADAADFPDADAVIKEAGGARGAGAAGGAPVYAVVATQGQWDEEAAAAALKLSPTYLGVMASAKRFTEMSALLAEQASSDALARVKNPAGLDLGADLPEEIAVSILAEIVAAKHAKALVQPKAQPTVQIRARPSSPSPEARDPVCNMMVRIEGAAHTARVGERDYYFCCGGCRARFLAAPEKYGATAGAGAGGA